MTSPNSLNIVQIQLITPLVKVLEYNLTRLGIKFVVAVVVSVLEVQLETSSGGIQLEASRPGGELEA